MFVGYKTTYILFAIAVSASLCLYVYTEVEYFGGWDGHLQGDASGVNSQADSPLEYNVPELETPSQGSASASRDIALSTRGSSKQGLTRGSHG